MIDKAFSCLTAMSLLLGLALLLTTPAWSEDRAGKAVIDADENPQVFTIGQVFWGNFPPFIWQSPNSDKFQGFRINHTELVMQAADLQYRWVTYTDDTPYNAHLRVLEDLRQEKIDLYVVRQDMVDNIEDYFVIDYPAYQNDLKAYALASRRLQLDSREAFIGLKGGYVSFTELEVFRLALQRRLGLKEQDGQFVIYKNHFQLIQALMDGDIDYALGSEGYLAIYTRFMGVWRSLKVFTIAERLSASHWLMSKQGKLKPHSPRISKVLQSFQERGRTRRLLDSARTKYIKEHGKNLLPFETNVE